MNKKVASMILAATMVVAAIPMQVSAAEEEHHFRIANVTQETNPMNQACESFIRLVEEKSEGRITFDNYPAAQLGSDTQLFAQVQEGSLDMALISAADIGATNDLAAALQLPFMFTDWAQYEDVITNDVTKDLLAGFDENGVAALAVWNAGNRYFCGREDFIRTPDDIAGKKIRIANTPLCQDIFKALGTAPTVIDYGEIYTGLQNKVIDLIEMDMFALHDEKHYEIVKYITPLNLYTWPAIFMVNKDVFESLSAEDQELFRECADEVIAENIAYIEEGQTSYQEELEGDGVQFLEGLSDEETAAWVEKEKEVQETWCAKDERIKAFFDYAISTQ